MKLLSVTMIPIFLFFIACSQASAADSTKLANIKTYYQKAVQYKNGNGVPIDYMKAVYYFNQAAEMGDAQSTYALAYMKYKGLGCDQDYRGAATLFAQGAFSGRENSIYFYALCWRNGYGVTKNEDSALYWLRRDSVLGYKQAKQELLMKAGENSNDSAKALVQRINNAAMPSNATPNQYKKIANHLPPVNVVAGSYTGWIIQYDWSGQNTISAKKLSINFAKQGNGLIGTWIEDGVNDSVQLQAMLRNDSVVFNNTQYKQKDHYSPDSGVTYSFRNASLNLVQNTDSIFLAGNVNMFSSFRGEPSKPLFVALARATQHSIDTDIGLRVSPNPFTSTINVEFTIPMICDVEVQLLSTDGTVVYRNAAGTLDAGHYILPLQPGFIAPGVYLIKVKYGKNNATIKIIKEG